MRAHRELLDALGRVPGLLVVRGGRWGENIAWLKSGAIVRHFMTSWLHSSGHRLNLLSTSFDDAGFGHRMGRSTVERRRCGRRSSATRAAESRPRRSERRPEPWVGERFTVRDTPRARKPRAVGKDDAWEFSNP
jgi:hypothetical protein